MTTIDKAFVKRSFNFSASTYDKHAGLQNRMVTELLGLAYAESGWVAKVLDIGMGTGNLTARLLEKFPSAHVHGCDIAEKMIFCAKGKLSPRVLFTVADAEFLPYKIKSFDLVVSSFTFQWLEPWNRALEQVQRVLKPGGIFVFSVFGSKTFTELKQSYTKACMHTGYTGGQALELSLTERKIKNLMISCGFREPLTRTCEVVEDYPCVNELIRSIKGMGARNASDRRNKTPGVRKVWKKMVELYEKDFGVQDKIPATFEIIMGRGVKA
jgi:malonyl-CoA O-methyltransferase